MPFPVRAVAMFDNSGSVYLPKAFGLFWCGPGYGRREKEKLMKKLMKRFLKDEQGLELSEYAVMAALVIVVAAAVIITVGEEINVIFGKLLDALQGTAPAV